MNARDRENVKKSAAAETEDAAQVESGSKTAPADASNGAASAEVSIEKEIAKLASEKDELKNTLIRLQADFDNYRKRIERERQQERHRGAEVLVESLLPVLDAFDRAISSHKDPAYDEYRKGFELIRRQLFDALAKRGLERIETAGQAFNPHFHHAVERVETIKHPDDAVLEELQAGYVFHGKVLRPAMVRVAANPSDESEKNSAVN